MSSNDMKISVIIPAYNISEYLPRCLDSVINQTHNNLEIIVISDGSTDGTNEIIKAYAEKDSRIVAVFKENSGVSDTRNRGLDIATGDYIGFVDGDDYIEPDMYEFLLKNAIENDADISHCGYQMVFPSRIDFYYNTGKKIIQNNKQCVIDFIKGEFVEPGIWNKLYKRDVIRDIRMPEDLKINEDVVFNIRAFVNSKKSIYEDKTPYHYILRKGSATTASLYSYNKLFDTIEASKRILDEVCDYDCDVIKFAVCRYVRSILSTFKSIRINKVKVFYDEVNLYLAELKKINNNKLSAKLVVEKYLALCCPFLYCKFYDFYDRYISKNKDIYEVK